jgi:hypothetical protein
MTLSAMVKEQFGATSALTPAELRYVLRWHPADGSAGHRDAQTGDWVYRYQIAAKFQNMLRSQETARDVVTAEGNGRCDPSPCSATHHLTDHPQTPAQLRAKAEALWQALDDISTAFDMFRPEMCAFAKHVQSQCEKRSKHFQSDGYKLYATAAPNMLKDQEL